MINQELYDKAYTQLRRLRVTGGDSYRIYNKVYRQLRKVLGGPFDATTANMLAPKRFAMLQAANAYYREGEAS